MFVFWAALLLWPVLATATPSGAAPVSELVQRPLCEVGSATPGSGTPLLLTALSLPTVTTLSGLCRGHTLAGSERYCIQPGGAADITVVAQLHRAEGSGWPTTQQLSTLSLSLLADSIHPLLLTPPVLLPQLLPASVPLLSDFHLQLPFRGVLTASSSRLGLFQLHFLPANSPHVVQLGSVNSTVAVEVTQCNTQQHPLSNEHHLTGSCYSTSPVCCVLLRAVVLGVRDHVRRWRFLQRSRQYVAAT